MTTTRKHTISKYGRWQIPQGQRLDAYSYVFRIQYSNEWLSPLLAAIRDWGAIRQSAYLAMDMELTYAGFHYSGVKR